MYDLYMADAPAGLRERKKRRTRLEISDVATRLFAKHGFEAVTLAQIADSADVSVKTIFNHFGSKEELYFDRADDLRDALIDTVCTRPAGTTALDALHGLMAENLVPFPGTGWDALDDPRAARHLRAFFAVEDRSPALKARRLMLTEDFATELRQALAGDLQRDAEDPALLMLVASLSAAMSVRNDILRGALAEQVSADEVRRRVLTVVDEGFARLRSAFADVDRVRS
jgi:AcrR family transcriptional regulator